MIKVLVIITTKFVSWGGLTNAYMNYYRVMDQTDLLIDIASIDETEPALKVEIESHGGHYIPLIDKRKRPIAYLFQLKSVCKGYDVLHVHGNSATMACELVTGKLNGISNRIAHCHTSKCMHPWVNTILLPFFFYSYTQGIACSKEAGSWLYGKKKFMVLNNAIDTEKFSFHIRTRKKTRAELMLDDEIVIGHVGKLYEAKNHTFLLKVFKEIHATYPKTKLLLIGDGVLRNSIQEEAVSYGIEADVIFMGMRDDTENYYPAMDLFAFPSLYEGFGLALLEAQCSGLSCFVSDQVPLESNVSGNVTFEPLILNTWITEIKKMISALPNDCERIKNSIKALKCVKAKGFDNRLNSNILRQIYLRNTH